MDTNVTVMKLTVKNVLMMYVQGVNVMDSIEHENIAWKKFRKTPGMKQIWTHCDMFVGIGVGCILGAAIGSIIALIVCGS